MEVIVWTHGEKCEKTPKDQKPLLNAKNELIQNVPYRGEYNIRKNDRFNEDRENEIMKRRMVPQTCQNPFLSKDFNAVIADQAKFLIPKNSLISKTD
jgi:hypothetical protein